MLYVPLPVPVAVAPLLRVTVHAPVAVTLPVMLADAPEQIAAFVLLTVAVGRVFSEIAVAPVKPAERAAQLASVNEVSV